MVDSQCKILWKNNSGSSLGHQPTVDYGSEADDYEKQALICQQILRYKMPSLCIKNSLTTDMKRKLMAYKT